MKAQDKRKDKRKGTKSSKQCLFSNCAF